MNHDYYRGHSLDGSKFVQQAILWGLDVETASPKSLPRLFLIEIVIVFVIGEVLILSFLVIRYDRRKRK